MSRHATIFNGGWRERLSPRGGTAFSSSVASNRLRLRSSPNDAEKQAESDEPDSLEVLETAVETALFSSRFLVLLAVLGTISTGGIMFVEGAATVAEELRALAEGNHAEVSLLAISSLDDFLTGCAALVFGLGLYELFISNLDYVAHGKIKKGRSSPFSLENRPVWLKVDSLSDLKHSLGAIIILVMVVNIFELSKEIRAEDPQSLVYLSIAALLSSLAIFTIGLGGGHGRGSGGGGDGHGGGHGGGGGGSSH